MKLSEFLRSDWLHFNFQMPL